MISANFAFLCARCASRVVSAGSTRTRPAILHHSTYLDRYIVSGVKLSLVSCPHVHLVRNYFLVEACLLLSKCMLRRIIKPFVAPDDRYQTWLRNALSDDRTAPIRRTSRTRSHGQPTAAAAARRLGTSAAATAAHTTLLGAESLAGAAHLQPTHVANRAFEQLCNSL